MFDVALLYETFKQTELANKQLLELLQKIDVHPTAYRNSVEFQRRVVEFNQNLTETYHLIEQLVPIMERFNRDMRELEEPENVSYFNNRRIIQRRKIQRREVEDRRANG